MQHSENNIHDDKYKINDVTKRLCSKIHQDAVYDLAMLNQFMVLDP